MRHPNLPQRLLPERLLARQGEGRRVGGLVDISWGPQCGGPPAPLSPWATGAPRDPQSRCCQTQELPVWSSPWALRLCFLKGAEAIKRADSDPQPPPDHPGLRGFVPGSDGRFCICPPCAGSALCWRMIPPRDTSACLGNLASPPVREDPFRLEGVPGALCRGGGCPAVHRGSRATIRHLVACGSLKLGPAGARWG